MDEVAFIQRKVRNLLSIHSRRHFGGLCVDGLAGGLDSDFFTGRAYLQGKVRGRVSSGIHIDAGERQRLEPLLLSLDGIPTDRQFGSRKEACGIGYDNTRQLRRIVSDGDFGVRNQRSGGVGDLPRNYAKNIER